MTVLICTFNRPQYLPGALRSILAQTCENFEIILTRDGGMPVREVIDEFLADPRLVFIDRDENRGKAHSLNRALERGRGRYVCYLDDDDAWYPNHIETLVTALESRPQFGLAYSDLYKAHCRYLPDGRRLVLAKNVEISRDFDRMMMLQFNHALHVSVMHRRDLLETAGGYNDQLRVLIDWDLTRRLCFYTDFLHVPVVTGQYYAAVGQSDRISVQQRKNVGDYLRNLLTIRTTRPPKPWPCMPDLAVIVTADQPDSALEQTLQTLFSQSFYPRTCCVVLPENQRVHFRTSVPDISVIAVPAGSTEGQKIDAALARCAAEFVAVVPAGLKTVNDEIAFLERSLNPLLADTTGGIAYEIVESTPQCRGIVIPAKALARARTQNPLPRLEPSLVQSGIEIRRPEFTQYPFQFDNFLTAASQLAQSGDWDRAAKTYDFIASRHGNSLWMKTLQANALYWAGHDHEAAVLARQLNRESPTPARLLIEARALRKMGRTAQAADCCRRAEAILDGRTAPNTQTENGHLHPQETLSWTH